MYDSLKIHKIHSKVLVKNVFEKIGQKLNFFEFLESKIFNFFDPFRKDCIAVIFTIARSLTSIMHCRFTTFVEFLTKTAKTVKNGSEHNLR